MTGDSVFDDAFARHQSGDIDAAEAAYRRIIAQDPQHFGALHYLGVALMQTGRAEEGIGFLDQALALNSADADALYNRGSGLMALGRWQEALVSFDAALVIRPVYANARFNRAAVLAAMGDLDGALEGYAGLLAAKPENPDVLIRMADLLNNRGLILTDTGRPLDALADFERALSLDPRHGPAMLNKGGALFALGRFEEALAGADILIAAHDPSQPPAPYLAEAFNNRANALKSLLRFDEALEAYGLALDVRPDYAEAHYNRADTLKQLHRLDEAVAGYDEAIRLKPDFAEAYWNKALGLLLAGDWERGWPLYEWRWRATGDFGPSRDLPLWLGQQPVAGRTILVVAEQGLGDTIQFCRYAAVLAALGARVWLEAPLSLHPLLQGLQGVDRLIAPGAPLDAADLQCPIMSLPVALGVAIDAIPKPEGYLAADPARLDAWRARLGPARRPRVGLVWSGNPKHGGDAQRSIPLGDLAPHLPSGIDYVSLQADIRPACRSALQAHGGILDLSGEIGDFADTAALCSLMDLVISVDTSVAHLAGALGRPTWILLPYTPDWRWMLGRTDSPWYGSARLYRQDPERRWDPVLVEVAHQLSALAG